MNFILFLLLSFSFSAHSGQLRLKKYKSKIGFSDGVYKAVKGSKPDCVSGRFEFFEADDKVIHLKAAESIFASNVHTKLLTSNDDSCEMSYKTKFAKNGFTNVESMECIEPDTFYTRGLKIQFSKNYIKYQLKTKQGKKAKTQVLTCVLKRTGK